MSAAIHIRRVKNFSGAISAITSNIGSLNLYRGQPYYPDINIVDNFNHDLSLKPSAWRNNDKTKQMFRNLDEYLEKLGGDQLVKDIQSFGTKEAHLRQSLAEMIALEQFSQHANKMALYVAHAHPFGFTRYQASGFYHWLRNISSKAYGYLNSPDRIRQGLDEYQNVSLNLDIFVNLSLAQHHGIPTRLLDWSLSPLKAMYFALNTEHLGSRPALIKLNYSACVKNGVNVSLIDMVPLWTNEFLHKQEGVFTYAYPTTFESTTPSLEELLTDHQNKRSIECLLEIIILDGCIDEMKKQLNALGVSKLHLFPSYSTCSEVLFPR